MPLPQVGMGGPVDPAQFVWAVSSRLPTVEDASPADGSTGPSPRREPERLVKVSWWRPHGVSYAQAVLTAENGHRPGPQAVYPQSTGAHAAGELGEGLACRDRRDWRGGAGAHRAGRGAEHAGHEAPTRGVHDTLWVPVPVRRSRGPRGQDREPHSKRILVALDCGNRRAVLLPSRDCQTRAPALRVRQRVLHPRQGDARQHAGHPLS
jgi:hypothetical protein